MPAPLVGALQLTACADTSFALASDHVSDDIVENTEDTMTLLERYIDDLPINLSKDRLKNTTRELYIEAQDLEI